MGLHGYKSFISNSVPVAQNYRIRPKHRRKIRQSNNRQNSLYSAGSLTERTVLRMVHRFVRGAPRGFIDSKSTTFFPWSSEVLWEVISKNTGTVKFCSHFFQWGFQVPNSNTWTKQHVSSCCSLIQWSGCRLEQRGILVQCQTGARDISVVKSMQIETGIHKQSRVHA